MKILQFAIWFYYTTISKLWKTLHFFFVISIHNGVFNANISSQGIYHKCVVYDFGKPNEVIKIISNAGITSDIKAIHDNVNIITMVMVISII